MEILVIVDHPNIQESRVHQRWMYELNKHPAKFSVHHLNETYPNGIIDIRAEQELLSTYDCIVIQFPFYWFNCPPLLKKWLDEVFTYGWAYGRNSGYALEGKKIHLAISAGIQEKEYTANGRYKYSVEELIRPFELTFEYVKANYSGAFVFYGFENDVSESLVEESIISYFQYLNNISNRK